MMILITRQLWAALGRLPCRKASGRDLKDGEYNEARSHIAGKLQALGKQAFG